MFKAQLIGTFGLAQKEITRVVRIWTQTFVSSIVTMALYLIIFGHILGQHIGTINGYSYIDFLAPGLIMMQVITSSYSNTASSIFGQKFNRSIEEILVSPMNPLAIITGFCLGSIFRAAVLAISLIIVAHFLTQIVIAHVVATIFVILLCSILMSLLGLVNGIFANHFDQLNMINSFIITPLIYLGGVFYSIYRLPPLWQKISLLNPIAYMVGLFRYTFIGYHIPHIYIAYTTLIILNLALIAINYYLLSAGIKIKK